MSRHVYAMLIACQCLALLTSASAIAQVIDFETLPDGSDTSDEQQISTEYAGSPFGVSFTVVDDNEQFLAFPRIAKTGDPLTAFQGCPGADEPLPGQGLGSSFLTDNDSAAGGPIGNLLISYSAPVAAASGQIVDTERRGSGEAEEWLVTARDSTGATVGAPVTIVAPMGPDNSCSVGTAGKGPGDGLALTWVVQSPTQTPTISSILIEYVGTAAQVGLAFDNFSPASCPGTALEFDGTNDEVRIPDAPSLDLTGDITAEAWVKLPASQSANIYSSGIIQKSTGGNNYAGTFRLNVRNQDSTPFFMIGDGVSAWQTVQSSTVRLGSIRALFENSQSTVRPQSPIRWP